MITDTDTTTAVHSLSDEENLKSRRRSELLPSEASHRLSVNTNGEQARNVLRAVIRENVQSENVVYRSVESHAVGVRRPFRSGAQIEARVGASRGIEVNREVAARLFGVENAVVKLHKGVDVAAVGGGNFRRASVQFEFFAKGLLRGVDAHRVLDDEPVRADATPGTHSTQTTFIKLQRARYPKHKSHLVEGHV